ncbi:hypothetical protein Tco_0795338 [Tanacetum coccineum]
MSSSLYRNNSDLCVEDDSEFVTSSFVLLGLILISVEAITPLSLEGGVEALVRIDPMHAEEVQRIKRKISDNASAMPSLVKRIKDCTSRIEKLEASKQVIIYPAFARKQTT